MIKEIWNSKELTLTQKIIGIIGYLFWREVEKEKVEKINCPGCGKEIIVIIKERIVEQPYPCPVYPQPYYPQY